MPEAKVFALDIPLRRLCSEAKAVVLRLRRLFGG